MAWRVFPDNEQVRIGLFIRLPSCDGAKEDDPVHRKLRREPLSRYSERIA
jgi:hypothetical protein